MKIPADQLRLPKSQKGRTAAPKSHSLCIKSLLDSIFSNEKQQVEPKFAFKVTNVGKLQQSVSMFSS